MSDWRTPGETAERLGVNRRTIYDGVAAGTIPHRRAGRRVLIPAWWGDAGGPASDGHPAADPVELARRFTAAVLAELGQALSEAARRATAADGSATVLDLNARDDESGRPHAT